MNLALFLSILMAGCSSAEEFVFKADHYIITAEEDGYSEQQAEYLYKHLSKRTTDNSPVTLHKGITNKDIAEGTKIIHIEVAKDLKNDYCIKHSKNRLHLRMKNQEVAMWMTYEVIAAIAQEDKRILAEDLPPSSIYFLNECKDFDFEYRDPHFAPNLEEHYSAITGNHNVESDWGLWGHNLPKISKDAENENIYAYVGKKRIKDQFSFASSELFNLVSEYIVDNYGEGKEKSYRFMVMPNDNDLVCICAACTELGNTETNATPAVNAFIRKLAERFPNHEFFTVAYRTVKKPPIYQLTENVGVFLSTIDVPKGNEIDKNHSKTKEFLDLLNTWKGKTSKVYLWDYAANFDDYLTPIPVLYGVQKQLKYYREQGVNGVFYNGSGYDYMPFDDVKTYVLGALMKEVTADIEKLVNKFFEIKYPQNHSLLSEYYLKLEKDFNEKNIPYNMYGSFKDNLNYLNPEDFKSFYNQLGEIIPKAPELEKTNLNKLYIALTFTRLQVLYSEGADAIRNTKKTQLDQWLQNLEYHQSFSDLRRYREVGGHLSEYISEWNDLLYRMKSDNLLKNTKIEIISEPDHGYENPNILNDGIFGFPSDYHQGWFLSSNRELKISFHTDNIKDGKYLNIRFLNDEKHRFHLPEKIEIFADGKTIKTLNEIEIKKDELSSEISFEGVKHIEIVFYPKKNKENTIAIDEILILK